MAQRPVRHDLKRMACSLPMVRLARLARELAPGQSIEACSDNPGFADDVRLLCENTGLVIRLMESAEGLTTVVLSMPE